MGNIIAFCKLFKLRRKFNKDQVKKEIKLVVSNEYWILFCCGQTNSGITIQSCLNLVRDSSLYLAMSVLALISVSITIKCVT